MTFYSKYRMAICQTDSSIIYIATVNCINITANSQEELNIKIKKYETLSSFT